MEIILRLEIIINKRLFVNVDSRGRRASVISNGNFEFSCTPARGYQVKAHDDTECCWVGGLVAGEKMNTPIRSWLLILVKPISLIGLRYTKHISR